MLEKEICKRLGVSVDSFNVYKKQFSELSEAVRPNKDIADAEVENSFFKNCVDRDVQEVSTTEFKGSDGVNVRANIVTKTVKKRIAGNVTAQKFWLLNRQPKKYRQRVDVEANIKDVTELEKQKQLLDSLPLAERLKLLKDMDDE